MILIRLCVDGVCGLTPELSRPASGNQRRSMVADPPSPRSGLGLNELLAR